MLRQLGQQPLGLLLHLLAGLQHHGLLDVAEAHGPGQVADGRVAQLRRDHEPVQDLADVGAGLLRQLAGVEPPLEQGADGRELGGRALLCQEDPEDGRLERRGPLQVGHPVVQQDP